MTTTLTHPPAEDLGCFIEGTLGDEARAVVVEHLADCDDCRLAIVDATEFADPAAFDRDLVVKPPPAGGRWWVAAAAAIAIAVGGVWLVDARRDPLAPVKEASSKLSSRLVEARLNGFPYVVRKAAMRGAGGETDLAASEVEQKAIEVLERRGDDARMQHAKGVALLLRIEAELPELTESNAEENERRAQLVKDRTDAVAKLQMAADREPENAVYQSDLAAALIDTGDVKNIKLAADICDRVVKRNPRSLEALFNKAKALEMAGQPQDAVVAYQGYLNVDPSSPWANEARDRVRSLQDLLKPLP